MNLDINKKNIIYQIDKKIAENNLKIPFLQAIIESVEKVKHHKNITIAIEKQCSKKVYLDKNYSGYLIRFSFENSVYKTSLPDKNGITQADYFKNYSDEIRFSDYMELKKNCEKKIHNIQSDTLKLTTEKDNFDIFFKQATELKKLYNTFDDTYSFTIKQSINF